MPRAPQHPPLIADVPGRTRHRFSGGGSLNTKRPPREPEEAAAAGVEARLARLEAKLDSLCEALLAQPPQSATTAHPLPAPAAAAAAAAAAATTAEGRPDGDGGRRKRGSALPPLLSP